MNRRRAILAACLCLAGAGVADPEPATSQSRPAPRDLADIAAGTYAGDVISDARGASRSGVRITVVKIAPNRVRISADYPRLPSFEAGLTRAMDTIQNASGDQVFLLDLSLTPNSLHLTVDDASWAGTRE